MPEAQSNGALSFFWSYEHGVDDQRRVQVPSAWRPADASAQFILLPWKHPTGDCLRVLTPAKMGTLLQTVDAMTDRVQKASLKRWIGSQGVAATLDKVGRVSLPAELASFAGIKKLAKLVGCIDEFEIWSPERHRAVKTADEAVAPRAAELLG